MNLAKMIAINQMLNEVILKEFRIPKKASINEQS